MNHAVRTARTFSPSLNVCIKRDNSRTTRASELFSAIGEHEPHFQVRHDKIVSYHLAKVSKGPTESHNNLINRIKRLGFGFRNFENYRIRGLLYAGKPNWRALGSIVVR